MRKATLQTLRTLTRPLFVDPQKNGTTNGESPNGNHDVKVENGVELETSAVKLGTSELKLEPSDVILEKEANEVILEKSVVKVENSEIESEKIEVKSEKSEVESEKCEVKSEKCEVKLEKSEVEFEESEVKDLVNGKVDMCLNWTPELLQEAMRHVYQRVLFEHVHEIQEIALQVS